MNCDYCKPVAGKHWHTDNVEQRALAHVPPSTSDGYPDEECLSRLAHWDWADLHGAMRYAQAMWYGGEDFCWRDGETWYLITVGWSGNEDIVAALQSSHGWWVRHWASSHRGGKFVFGEAD